MRKVAVMTFYFENFKLIDHGHDLIMPCLPFIVLPGQRGALCVLCSRLSGSGALVVELD